MCLIHILDIECSPFPVRMGIRQIVFSARKKIDIFYIWQLDSPLNNTALNLERKQMEWNHQLQEEMLERNFEGRVRICNVA